MPQPKTEMKGEIGSVYTVHEETGAQPGLLLLGPPLSGFENYQAAVADAKSRGEVQPGKAFAVCLNDIVVWPL